MGIGKRIKEARLKNGLTQEELAKAIGVTKGAIANYEGDVSHPKEPIMYALINVLGVDANYLFQDCVNIKKQIPAPVSESEDRSSQFMRLFETLPDDRKDEVLRYIQFLSGSSEHNK